MILVEFSLNAFLDYRNATQRIENVMQKCISGKHANGAAVLDG